MVKDTRNKASQGWSRGYFRFQQTSDGSLRKSFDPILLSPDNKVKYSKSFIKSLLVKRTPLAKRRLDGSAKCGDGDVMLEEETTFLAGGKEEDPAVMVGGQNNPIKLGNTMIQHSVSSSRVCKHGNEGRQVVTEKKCEDFKVMEDCTQYQMHIDSEDPRDGVCVFCYKPPQTETNGQCSSYAKAVELQKQDPSSKLMCFGIPRKECMKSTQLQPSHLVAILMVQ